MMAETGATAALRAMLDRLAIGVAVHRDSRLLYCNARYASLTGHASIAEALATPLDAGGPTEARAVGLSQGMAEDGTALWLETRSFEVDWEGMPAVEMHVTDVSERVTAEAKISQLTMAAETTRESEQRLLSILETSPIGVTITTRDGTYLFSNGRNAQIMGHKDANAYRETNAYTEYPDPGIRTRMKDALYRDGFTPETEVQLRRADGELIWVLMTSRLIDFSGRQAHITWCYDITKRRATEAMTRENEQRLLSILENSPVGVNISTREGEHLFANNRMARIMGHADCESYRQANAYDEYPDPTLRTRMKEALYRDGFTPETEIQLRRIDGKLIWVLMSSQLIEFADRPGHITWSYDITERRAAQSAIAESEGRLRSVTDNLPGAVLRLVREPDGTLRVPFINSGVESLLGTPPERVIDTADGIDHLIPAAEKARFVATLDASRDERTQTLFEYAIDTGTKTPRWLRFMAFPRLGEDGALTWDGLLLDSTEWKKADIAKRSFVSMVSHELRTPLTSIRGSLGLIAGGSLGPVPERMMRLIQIANSNSERLTRLINDLLDIEKIEAERLEFDLQRCALAGLLRQAVESNAGYGTPRQVSIALIEPIPEVDVMVDADRFMQVMSNLLSNAIKYSPDGGRVEVSAAADAGGCKIEVRDYGSGIPAEFQPRIFERFAQADISDQRARSGTGLGLGIAKAIVEHHGGTIRFETSAETGTSFFVLLPACPAETAPVAESRRVVLICEDDPDAAEVIAAMVAKSGFATRLAHSAAEARTLLATDGPFAALLLDIALPDEDGILLLDALRRDRRTDALPVAIISAYAKESRARHLASRFDVIEWFSKPVDENRLGAFLLGLEQIY